MDNGIVYIIIFRDEPELIEQTQHQCAEREHSNPAHTVGYATANAFLSKAFANANR